MDADGFHLGTPYAINSQFTIHNSQTERDCWSRNYQLAKLQITNYKLQMERDLKSQIKIDNPKVILCRLEMTRVAMEYRTLGGSGFKVPVLSLGTGTFGGGTEFFRAWGATDVAEATRLVDICLDAGLHMFDSADVYSKGGAEEILGQAIKGRRDRVIVSTKGSFRMGTGPNDLGSSRHYLTRAVEASLRRLGTDYIDLYQLHGFDAQTPIDEVLHTLDDLVRAGKIRYIGCSNFSGWHLMKSLAMADRYGLTRYVAHQAYYSLVGREYEWELMPLALDQRVSAVVWSPLGWGRLTGKIRRGQPLPAVSRLQSTLAASLGPQVPEEYLYRVVDALDVVSRETGKSVPQIAINWLTRRPSVATVIIGARDEQQLRDNLAAVDFVLNDEHMATLDTASALTPIYPYWHQRGYERNPSPV
jgi:aryl-alcohol dehydrogenase-like predicted oxidoreductase